MDDRSEDRRLVFRAPVIKRIYLFVFAFLVSTAFWLYGLDAIFSGRLAVMAIGAPLYFFLFNRHISAVIIALAFLCLMTVGITILWTPDTTNGIQEFLVLWALFGCFMIGVAEENLFPLWLGLGFGMMVSSVIGVFQLLGYWPVQAMVLPSGLFVNKNVLAEASAVVLVTMASKRFWWLAVPALGTVIMCTSRAAIGAVVATFAFYCLKSRPKIAYFIFTTLTIVALWATFARGDPSAIQRVEFWTKALENLTFFGHGLGSFAVNYPYAEYAHSEPIQYLYELGVFIIVPLVMLLALFCPPFSENFYDTERLVTVLVLFMCLFSFPLHMPVTAFAAAVSVGALAHEWFDLRWCTYPRGDSYFRRTEWQTTESSADAQ